MNLWIVITNFFVVLFLIIKTFLKVTIHCICHFDPDKFQKEFFGREIFHLRLGKISHPAYAGFEMTLRVTVIDEVEVYIEFLRRLPRYTTRKS